MQSRWIWSLFALVLGTAAVRQIYAGETARPEPAAVKFEDGLTSISDTVKDALFRDGLSRIAVPGFVGPDGTPESIGAAGFYVADGLQRRLKDASRTHPLDIQNRRSLGPVLNGVSVRAADLTVETLPQSVRRAGIEALVLGKITRLTSCVELEVSVVKVLDRATIATKVVRVADDPMLLAQLGENIAALKQPIASLAPTPQPATNAPGADIMSVPGIVAAAADPDHPIPQLSGSPFGLDLVVEGQTLPLRRSGSALYVAAQKGRKYAVRLTNKYGKRVGVVLLIDGLDTINIQEDTYHSSQTTLATRHMWILDAHGGKLDVEGWQGRDYYEEFVFSDAAGSLAARQQFTEHIGVITAAFFLEAEPGKGEVGTTTGRRVQTGPVAMEHFHTDKEPVAILSLRYDSPEVVDRFEPVETGKAPAAPAQP